MKPEVRIVKIKRGNWRVQFNIGNQYFTVMPFENTKEEATWMARMLKIAFKNLLTDNKK